MTGFDLTPLYRSTVGFDRLANIFDALGAAPEKTASYPPYNVERTGERDYRITMAVAGFSEDELDIEECCGVLSARCIKATAKHQTAIICIAALPIAALSGVFNWPTMFYSMPQLITACYPLI